MLRTVAFRNRYYLDTVSKKGLASAADMKSEHHKALLTECALPAALEAVGERWSFLILRATFNGLHHFEEFQSTLGIARNILSNRLARLVEHDILTREPDATDRRKVAYRLTPKGRELLPVLVDRASRMPVAAMTVHAMDGRPLSLGELDWVDQSEIPEFKGAASSPAADPETAPPPRSGAHALSEASSSSS